MDRDRGWGCMLFGTDWPATFIYAAMILSCFALWCAAFAYGQPLIATHGMAWNGNICGVGDNEDAPQQAWINPTMTSSIFASSVCMPSCPYINTTNVVHNDTKTVDNIEAGVATIPDPALKASTEASVSHIERRVDNLKSEVTYLESHMGDALYELDRKNIYCLCNAKKFPSFLKYNILYNIGALCNTTKASARGYIELPYQDSLSQFVGDGKNIALDSKAMDTVPCAFRYRTEKAFTRCLPWLSASSLGKITLVKGTAGIGDMVSSQFSAWSQRAVNVMKDLETGWRVVATACAIALFASIFLIYLMSCEISSCCKLLTFLVWGVLITLELALIAIATVCSYQCKYYMDRVETTPELTTKTEDEYAMYLFGIGAGISSFLALVHLIFMCPCVCGTNIDNSIEIIAAAAEVFEKAWGLLLYPMFHNFTMMIAIACWLVGLVFIATAGTLDEKPDGVHTLTYNEDMQRALYYYVFCLIWIVECMSALGFMVVCGGILIPFFDNKKVHGEEHESKYPWPVWSSFKLVSTYHLGTAAIGSFFITLMVIIRWMVTYLVEKARAANQEWLTACVNCCCACVENCLRYLVRTAYILTVMEDKWFFSAVCGGLSTVVENMGQIMMANEISFLLLWLCKLAVPLGCTFFAHLMIQGGLMGVHQEDLSSSFNVLVPVFLISCVFSWTFMGLLDTSIEVCLVAFCRLEEIQKELDEEGKGSLDVMKCVPEGIADCFTTNRERQNYEEVGDDERKAPLMGDHSKADDVEAKQPVAHDDEEER